MTETRREPGAPVPGTIRVATVLTGTEGFGVRTFLLEQLRHGGDVGLEFVHLCLQPGPMYEELRARGARVALVGGRVPQRFPASPLLLPLVWIAMQGPVRSAFRGLGRALAAERPDLVYTHSIYTAFLCGLLGRRLALPVVGQFHGILNRRRLCGAQRAATSLVMSRLLAAIVAVSETARRSFWGPARGKVTVIPNGVDVQAIREATAGVGKVPGRIVVVGRLAALKRQDLAIRAVRALADQGLSCTLDVVGGAADASNPWFVRLRDLARELGLAERVAFLGAVTPPYRQIAAAEASVSCSSIDSFGLVVAESMACGTALAVADRGGPAELVRDGESGLLFKAGDAGALACALKRLLTEPATRERLSARAAEQVRRGLGVGEHMRAVRALFERTLLAGAPAHAD